VHGTWKPSIVLNKIGVNVVVVVVVVVVYKCHLSEKISAVCVQTLQVHLHTAAAAKPRLLVQQRTLLPTERDIVCLRLVLARTAKNMESDLLMLFMWRTKPKYAYSLLFLSI
jgi:hypothetical protein